MKLIYYNTQFDSVSSLSLTDPPPDEDALQISRLFYVHSVISNYYTIRREEMSRLAK